MNTPTFIIEAIRNDTGNTTIFPIYTENAPLLNAGYYARHIDKGVYITNITPCNNGKYAKINDLCKRGYITITEAVKLLINEYRAEKCRAQAD